MIIDEVSMMTDHDLPTEEAIIINSGDMTTEEGMIILNYDEFSYFDTSYKEALEEVLEEMIDNNYECDFDFLLRRKLDDEWNDNNGRAFKFLNEEDILTYKIITTIESMYNEIEEEHYYNFGDNKTLEEKLDLIYYIKAQEYFRDWLIKEDFDTDNF
mgnify:CR=1 FL=1